MRSLRYRHLRHISILWLGLLAGAQTLAQTQVKPGFNLFSAEQDVEIGKQSAAEVEKQLPVLTDSQIQNYVSRIGDRLAQVVPGPQFPYQFKVTNVSDINAFALPGGYMYINRGLIEAVGAEAELAGVMAHEMAHVALRHGTNQVSKAYMGKAGLGVLGGLLGGGTTGDLIGAVGGFGLNSLFLKFSRSAEEQADVVGAQMLAKAGYDPMAMASMFEMLREKSGRDPSKFEQFFSSHPAPANRAQRIQKETNLIGGYNAAPPVGNIQGIQRRLQRMPAARSMESLSKAGASSGEAGSQGEVQGPVRVSVEQPSSRLRTFSKSDGLFKIRYPENWRVYEAQDGDGITVAPQGGIVRHQGQESIAYGMIVNSFDPGESNSRRALSLGQARDRLLQQIQETNPHLRKVRGSDKSLYLDGARALSVVLAGQSPVTDEEERVLLLTRPLSDNRLLYLLFIAPGRDYANLEQVFNRVASSLAVR